MRKKAPITRAFILGLVFVLSVVSGLIVLEHKNGLRNTANDMTYSYSSVENENLINIVIDGAVSVPGRYTLKGGSYLSDAINVAGGLVSDADISAIDLTLILNDKDKIIIPKKSEKSAVHTVPDKKININTATAGELKTLPGIGDVYAAEIISYRNKYGNFEVIQDIMRVSGIGENRFQNIKNYICVE